MGKKRRKKQGREVWKGRKGEGGREGGMTERRKKDKGTELKQKTR